MILTSIAATALTFSATMAVAWLTQLKTRNSGWADVFWSYAMGLGVVEAEPGGKAAEEIQYVYNYTCRILGLPVGGEGGDEKAERARKRTA